MTAHTTHIRYKSDYGSTQEYAEELARRLGVDAAELDHDIPDDGAPVILLSPVHGPFIPAATRAEEISGHPMAVVAVCLTLLDIARDKDFLHKQVPPECSTFYLPGRLDMDKLSGSHRATLASISTMLRAKPFKSANDKAMIAAVTKGADRVDFAELDPLVAWAEVASTSS
ncbi:MAG: flavodoxin domain-containing protein [Corynebacterium sp.]|nr:flavodoxin domain-containing protein [Corynebacterium sp.]